MTAASITIARDEMLAVFKAAWGTTGPVVYDDIPGAPPTTLGPWARVTIRHVPGHPVAFGGAGSLRHRYTGDLIVQIFTPIGDGLTSSDDIGTILLTAFRSARTASGVLFRKAGIKEVGPDPNGRDFQVNFTASFEYDMLG